MRRRSVSALAKLSRPRLRRVVPRDRLTTLIDQGRDRPVLWVSGPPGAGKTTLVADYSRASGLRTIWYLLDPADGDPATFFYFLREAAASASGRKESGLPLFTPEYKTNPQGFGRRFFRGLFEAIGPDALVVLDNFHEIAPDLGLNETLAASIDEIPPGSTLILISRAEPPPAFARALVNDQICRLDWDELRLTPDETHAIATSQGVSTAEPLDVLYALSGGWTAGVVLLAEQYRKTGALRHVENTQTMETIFDYFAGEILDATPTEVQEVLLRSALLPRVSAATAAAVSGNPSAIEHIERMHRRGLFIDRLHGPTVTYRFHALFQSFLTSRLKARLSPDTLRSLVRKAAAALEEQGDLEDAFALYVEGGDAVSAERLFIGCAPHLIAQGRWRVVGDWHSALRSCHESPGAWTHLWLGRALVPVQPTAARGVLDTAFRAFESLDDARGQILSGAGMLEALYCEYEQFRPMDPWIDRIERLLERGVVFDGPDEALWVHSSFLMACVFRRPDHPLMPASVRAVERLVRETKDVNSRVSVATLLHYYGYAALDERANRLATEVARPLLADRALTAQRAVMYLAEEGYAHYTFGRFREAIECLDEAQTIAGKHGLEEAGVRVLQSRGFCERRAGLLEAAAATARLIDRSPSPPTAFGAALVALLEAYIMFDQGDRDRAIALSESGLAGSDAAGQKRTQVLADVIHASMLIQHAPDAAATVNALLQAADDLSAGTVFDHQRGAVALMRTLQALRQGDRIAFARLVADLLTLGRDEKMRFCILWYRPILVEVLTAAVETGVSGADLEHLLRAAGMPPKAGVNDTWPWPVKIYSLGRFDVRVDDRPLEHGRKAPRKVLELLKLILASGGDAAEDRLIDVLWPDMEGDAARKALGALLHRLRKILGSPNAVRQKAGRLRLDREVCWVDADYFDRHTAPDADDAQFLHALEVYRGPFLQDDETIPWAPSRREHLRRRYIEAVRHRAARLLEQDDLQAAGACYLRGLEVEDADSLYEGLALCWNRLGRTSDAEQILQRLARRRKGAERAETSGGSPHTSR